MLGIDINEIVDVKINDATFKIGILPYGARVKLDSVTLRLAATSKISDEIEMLLGQHVSYVRYGVKGHSGIVGKDGKEIPFKASTEMMAGREINVVADETIDMYLMMGLIPKLAEEIYKLNKAQKIEIKN